MTQRQVGDSARDEAHPGIDIAVPIGSVVRAAGGGAVAQTGQDPEYGWFVLLQHVDGYQSMYGHLSRRLVAQGDSVVAGQVIGLTGNTGRSTRPPPSLRDPPAGDVARSPDHGQGGQTMSLFASPARDEHGNEPAPPAHRPDALLDRREGHDGGRATSRRRAWFASRAGCAGPSGRAPRCSSARGPWWRATSTPRRRWSAATSRLHPRHRTGGAPADRLGHGKHHHAQNRGPGRRQGDRRSPDPGSAGHRGPARRVIHSLPRNPMIRNSLS